MAKKRGEYAQNIELAYYPPEVREMMDNATHCLTCGKKLDSLQRKEARRNRGYCSMRCYVELPPKLSYAVRMSGKKPEHLISDTLNRTQNVTTAAELLGITKVNLYAWMRKFRIRRVVRWEVG